LEEIRPLVVLDGVSNDFIGLSRASLQEAKLARLSKLANLRKASRHYREKLGEIRSELAGANHEIELIEQQLERIVGFPTAMVNPGGEVPAKIKHQKTA
jgi:hypothetical protein